MLSRNPPPDVLRHERGSWALPGLDQLTGTRETIISLCVRNPPIVVPPGSPHLAVLTHRMEIVCTELAGNALRHARQPIHIHLSSTASSWLIRVDDASPDLTPVVGHPTAEQIGGRGLSIVVSLASAAGWYVRESVKTVWAEVPDIPPAKLLARLREA
ncbi:ATP-binding protein [Kineosporia succinea]|uniref:Histidine kinase-like protein n=1 Tax=Kineosporia succinea TaxID=84632 RepID=A0ABT9PBF0_9ACTN|nr:ATP-binding protein [Kineosporia succinea]MDP9829998.1 hypothetical protein [Kineosporia succinea]